MRAVNDRHDEPHRLGRNAGSGERDRETEAMRPMAARLLGTTPS